MLLIYVPICIRVALESIIDYIVAVAFYVLSIGASKLTIMGTISLTCRLTPFYFIILPKFGPRGIVRGGRMPLPNQST